MKVISRESRKTDAMSLSADETVFTFFYSRLSPFQSIVFIVLSSQAWTDGLIFNPWLWIDEKIRLYCGKTSPNTRLKHPHEADFVTLWANAALISGTVFSRPNFPSICDARQFLKCLPCLLSPALSVDVIQYRFVNLLRHFWCGHLVWSTITMFVLADRTVSFKLYHIIFYRCKRRSKLL